MIQRFLKGLAPLAALTMGAALSGCGEVDIKINGEEGVPLAELDMSGASPTELVVSANAQVVVTEGDEFNISVENDPDDTLRFVLDGETVGIQHEPDLKIEDSDAIVTIVMPAPNAVVIAGSGSIETAALSANSSLVIGGSGSITVTDIAAETLEVTIGGSGSVIGAGSADNLEVTIGGSGSVEMAGLKAGDAEVSIGGSGSVAFASDGTVEANLAGSGSVRVTGNATCSQTSIGSGTLTCIPTSNSAPSATEEPADSNAVLTDES